MKKRTLTDSSQSSLAGRGAAPSPSLCSPETGRGREGRMLAAPLGGERKRQNRQHRNGPRTPLLATGRVTRGCECWALRWGRGTARWGDRLGKGLGGSSLCPHQGRERGVSSGGAPPSPSRSLGRFIRGRDPGSFPLVFSLFSPSNRDATRDINNNLVNDNYLNCAHGSDTGYAQPEESSLRRRTRSEKEE